MQLHPAVAYLPANDGSELLHHMQVLHEIQTTFGRHVMQGACSI